MLSLMGGQGEFLRDGIGTFMAVLLLAAALPISAWCSRGYSGWLSLFSRSGRRRERTWLWCDRLGVVFFSSLLTLTGSQALFSVQSSPPHRPFAAGLSIAIIVASCVALAGSQRLALWLTSLTTPEPAEENAILLYHRILLPVLGLLTMAIGTYGVVLSLGDLA